MNYGFIEPKKEDLIKSKEAGYVFGSAKKLNPSMDWGMYYPEEERQFNRYLDTNGCTIFGTLNALETLAKFKYEKDWNKSERFVGAYAGMSPQGNNPHTVADTIRIKGVIPQIYMELDGVKSFEKLWDKDLADNYIRIANDWLKKYKVKHEWVNPEDIDEALKDSPLGVAVYAWVKDGDMYYQPEGSQPTHWTMLGAKKKDHYEIYDSYPPYIKKMPLDTKFKYIKKYELIEGEYNKSWLKKIINKILFYISKVIHR